MPTSPSIALLVVHCVGSKLSPYAARAALEPLEKKISGPNFVGPLKLAIREVVG
jgi:hypothetical protein